MRNNENNSHVGNSSNTKKFLYTGPKKDEHHNESWLFSPRKANDSPRTGTDFGMENVWSIQKNVSLGSPNENLDGLNMKANKTYYSRYGGAKGKDGTSTGGNFSGSNPVSREGQRGNSRSWNYPSKGFSYSSMDNSNGSPSGASFINRSRNANRTPSHSSFGGQDKDSSLW